MATDRQVRVYAVEAMRQHWQQLVNIDKADLAQELYVRQVNTRVHAIFSQHSSQTGGLLAWLPAWHKSLLAYVTSESGFLSSVLPEQHTVLLLQALSVALKGCTGYAAPACGACLHVPVYITM